MSNQGKIIVRWTDVEEDKLATIVSHLRLTQPEASILDLIRKAQEQLPIERRRKFHLINHVKRVIEKIRNQCSYNHDLLSRYNQLERPPEPQVVERIVEKIVEVPVEPLPLEEQLAQLSDEALAYYVRERRLSLSVLVGLTGLCLTELVENIVNQRLNSLAETIGGLHNRFDLLVDHLTRPNQAAKPTTDPKPFLPMPQAPIPTVKPKVVVLGLKSEQMQEVARACNGKIDLHFISKDARISTFPNCDYALLFTNWIDHGIQNQVVSMIGRDKVIMHKGGLLSGINRLCSLAQTAAPAISTTETNSSSDH